MSQTVIRGSQILNNTVQRQDLDTSTVGQAVVTKLVQGSGITLSSTGADAGTGDVTVSSPDVVSTDAGNIATLGTDSHILVPQSQIWSVRLRSFSSLGNSTFEIDQKLCGGTVSLSGTFSGPIIDRWYGYKAGTGAGYCAQVGAGNIVLPGTNFVITTHGLLFNTTTTQASLGATDTLRFAQQIEGNQMRELIGDVHSLQLLVSSTVTPLKFSVCLRDNPTTKSIVYLCTYNAAANTPQLITIPNIPVWASGGNWSTQPGNLGYVLEVTLACGSTYLTSPGVWANGTFLGATGMDNFLANAVNSQFVLRFIQHEPGALCTTPMDLDWETNYYQSLRYYAKSFDYATTAGTATFSGSITCYIYAATAMKNWSYKFARVLAKTPTTTIYNASTGSVGSVRDGGGVDRAVTVGSPSASMPFTDLNSTSMTAGQIASAHFVSDTGW